MSENAGKETEKRETGKDVKKRQKSWFQGVKAEFKKVIWPDKAQVGQQTLTVVAVSIVLGLIIAGIDSLVKFGLNFLT